MVLLSLLAGAVIGIALGMTGGGGATLGVPLLVYGLGLGTREAVAISLAAVGITSLIGFFHRWRTGQVEIPTGLLFAVAGMLGAPIGSSVATNIPEWLLMSLFGGLMMLVAVLLWRQASRHVQPASGLPDPDSLDAPTCRRKEDGSLILNSPCAALLSMVGLLTGFLSGMFGVGGGFVIVPALIFFSGMSVHRAIGTSLMVIALVSSSGVASQVIAGRSIPLAITPLFVIGGVAGLFAGQRIAARLSPKKLQKTFAIAILGIAAFVITKNLLA